MTPLHWVREFVADDTGPTAVEYAGIIAMTGAALNEMGKAITELLNKATANIRQMSGS